MTTAAARSSAVRHDGGVRRILLLPLLAAALVGLAGCTPATDDAPAGAPSTTAPATGPAAAAPDPTPSPTPAPTPPTSAATLEPQDVWVFPGPAVYVGDDLDVEVPTFGTTAPDVTALSVTWDDRTVGVDTLELVDPIVGGRFAFSLPVELEAGTHQLEITATVDDEPLERSRTVTVRPADERPDPGTWTSVEGDCCRLHAVTGTPVGDRLEEVAAALDRAARPVAERFGIDLDAPAADDPDEGGDDAGLVDIVVLANPWGNGGFANDERIVLALPERNPAPADPTTLYVHELTHVLQGRVAEVPTAFGEGLAVHTAGGHYAVTDLRAEAAALAASDDLVPLAELYDGFADLQHERRYLQAAAFVEWVVATHGEDALQAVLRHDAGDDLDPSEWLDGALQEVVGIDLTTADAAFDAWLAGADAQDVADATIGDLVRLQELRRRWQSTYAPWEALYVELRDVGRDELRDVGRDELRPAEDLDGLDPARAVRRPTSAAHVAVETVFAVAQQAQADGDAALLARLLDDLNRVVDRARVDRGLPARHLAVVHTLDLPAAEVAAIDIDDASATVTTTDGTTIDLALTADGWQPTASP